MGVKLQGSIWDWAVVTTGSRGDRDVVKGGLYTWVLSNQGSSLWAQLRIIRERERERERERVRDTVGLDGSMTTDSTGLEVSYIQ